MKFPLSIRQSNVILNHAVVKPVFVYSQTLFFTVKKSIMKSVALPLANRNADIFTC